MPQFYTAAPSDSVYTREELDSAAEAGRPLCAVGYGFACTDQTPEPQHGWRFRWINRRGMGNHGCLVLLPTDSRTWAIHRRGRLARLRELLPEVSEAGLDLLDQAARGQEHGSEPAVLRAAWALAGLAPDTLEACPGVGGGIARWRDDARWESPRAARIMSELPPLSCPRLDSAVGIARRLQG